MNIINSRKKYVHIEFLLKIFLICYQVKFKFDKFNVFYKIQRHKFNLIVQYSV